MFCVHSGSLVISYDVHSWDLTPLGNKLTDKLNREHNSISSQRHTQGRKISDTTCVQGRGHIQENEKGKSTIDKIMTK